MNTPPKISVIIPCFNHGEYLSDAVASVTSARREDVELVVIDDGSTDERTCLEMEKLRADGIRVIRQENKGLAAARNAGVAATTAPYILPLDADNRVRAGYFEHGIRILDSDPKVGIVYGDAQYFGERTGRWVVGAFEAERLLVWNYIDACAVYRRTIWEQNRGYDATMPVQGLEDWDFWLTALANGWRFHYEPEILFDYRVNKASMIAETHGHESEIQAFVDRKHGHLYRQSWRSLISEHKLLLQERESVRWNFRNLRELLKARFKQKFFGNGRNGQSDSQHSRSEL